MFAFSSDYIKTDVTAVKIFGNYIFAAAGNYLHIYKGRTQELVKKIFFSNEPVSNLEIYIHTNRLLLHGAKTMKLFYMTSVEAFDVTEIHSRECDDWILSAQFVDHGLMIVTVSMHNIVTLWNSEFEELQRCVCEEKCILYCAHIVNENWTDVVVLSGTVFNQILVWRPEKTLNGFCTIMSRLNGHKGVIFSIDYNLNNGLICSTSDDRTAILWSVQNKNLLHRLENGASIMNKSVLYNHSARVFKCKVLNNFILTSGEDGLVNVWNTEGILVRKIEAHQGGCIWSLDGDEENNMIVTGGKDGGVSSFTLNTLVQSDKIKLIGMKIPKKVIILSSNNLAIITEDGYLFYYNTTTNALKETYSHEDLKSYALLEKSSCGKFLVAAGFYGNIHFYEDLGHGLKYKLSCQIKNKGRIFSLHWLTCKLFLTCGPAGVLTLWIIRNHIVPIQFFYLPFSKERWTTSACLCGSDCILVGDRRGNLYLYSIYSCEPIQYIKKAHNYLGVTNVYCKGNNIISLGRNSLLNKYSLDSNQKRLNLMSSDKVPFTWLAAVHTTKSTNLLLGFTGNNLIVWDYKARRILLEKNCGGGHRSWDYNVNTNSFHFSFIKDKFIYLFSCDRSSLHSLNIVSSFHVNTINSLILLKSGNTCSNYIIISGGEDTTLRVSLTNFVNQKNVTTLKSHLSSVRVISSYKISQEHSKNGAHLKYLVFSAGGRAQIIMWELNVKVLNDNVTNVSCSEVHSFYEPLSGEESEIRIMDLSTLKIFNGNILLCAACSDGTIKLFSVEHKLCFLRSLTYKRKCILKIGYFRVKEYNILITMATDGNIVIWNIGEVHKNQSMQPISIIQAHQSGINTHSIVEVSEYDHLILTGGDDNAIALHLVQFNDDNGKLSTEILVKFNDYSIHCAQITGSYITEKYFITASIDQKICLFSWNIQCNKINVELLNTYITTICDIQGMECVDYVEGCKVIVYGNGFEILSLGIKLIPFF